MTHNKPSNLHPHTISVDGYDINLHLAKQRKQRAPHVPPPDERRCQHMMPSDVRCKALKMHGNTHCYFHAPEFKDIRVENSRKSGKKSRILPLALEHPVLESVEDVRQFAIEIIHQVRTGQIDVKTAQVMNQLMTHVIKTLPDTRQEKLTAADRLRELLSEDESEELESVSQVVQGDRSADWESNPVQAI